MSEAPEGATAEIQWRAKRLKELTEVKGYATEMAQNIIEVEARWAPWAPITDRFPTLPNRK